MYVPSTRVLYSWKAYECFLRLCAALEDYFFVGVFFKSEQQVRLSTKRVLNLQSIFTKSLNHYESQTSIKNRKLAHLCTCLD